MDLQIIIVECACASYVVGYVNKWERGLSNLHRKIIESMEEHPEFDIVQITRKLSVDVINSIEICAQEAAWYLLRLNMTVYIPTMWQVDKE